MVGILRSFERSWALRFAAVAFLIAGSAVGSGWTFLQHAGSARQALLLVLLAALAMVCAVLAMLRAGGELDALAGQDRAREPAFFALALAATVFVSLVAFLDRLVAAVEVAAGLPA